MAGWSKNASSDSTEGFSHQVFLSFRGEDVRKTFISHLLNALNQKGIKTFYDDETLPRGEDIQSKLYEAIEKSKLSIVTFSPGYATSRWCLDELVKIMERRHFHGHIVLPVFHNIEPTDVRNQLGTYKKAFDAHGEKYKNELERVKKWKEALKSAADLAGSSLENQANGYEALFVKQIISEVSKKAHEPQLYIPKYMIMPKLTVDSITHWLEYKSPNPQIGIIYGPVGVGKTTIAKVVFNNNCYKFDASSFLAGISNALEDSKNIILLQKQLIKNVSEATNVDHVHEGKNKVRDAIKNKRVLIVVDGVDEMKSLHEIFDFPEWFSPGSKVLVTTSNQRLSDAYDTGTRIKFSVRELSDEDSIELFCCHAFQNKNPPPGYEEILEKFIKYCGGLPWAIQFLASSLAGQNLKKWKNEFAKLEKCPNQKLQEVLVPKIQSLDNNDKNIFLNIAHFMIGMKKDLALMILNSCKLSGESGLDILIDKFLVRVDEFDDTIVMNNLNQQMGYEVVRQENDELGRRSRLVVLNDASDVLRKKTGTKNIKGLQLVFPDSNNDTLLSRLDVEKMRETKIMRESLINEIINSFVKLSLIISFFFIFPVSKRGQSEEQGNSYEPSNNGEVAAGPSRTFSQKLRTFETEAFRKIVHLDFLLLENVHLEGDFKDFPTEIKWLLWKGFPLESIPLNIQLDHLVILDMQKSCLTQAWEEFRSMEQLKILDLSYSQQLSSTPDLSGAPQLKYLFLKSCSSLHKIHESLGTLKNLKHLDIEGCEKLVNMPKSIHNLSNLTFLNLKKCKLLERFTVPVSVQELNAEKSQTSIFPIASTLPLDLNFPVLRTLNLAKCNISREDVMELLTCAPLLKILNLSNNPIRKLNNVIDLGQIRPLVLTLEHCNELESISQLTRLCDLNVEFCSSLKDISFVPCQIPYDKIYSYGCYKLHEVNYGFNDRLIIERIDDMDEARANYLGFHGLSSCVHEEDDHDYFGKGFYRGGIYQVILGKDYLSKMFNQIINKERSHHCVVPDNQKCIRGLILGMSAENYLTRKGEFPILRIRVKNITKKWEWELAAPSLGQFYDWERLMIDQDYAMTWLSYWRINEDRDLDSGDILKINYSDSEFLTFDFGVKFIYEDEEEEEEDVLTWYYNVFSFHHPDLSMYDRYKSLYPFEGLSDIKQYVVTHHLYQGRLPTQVCVWYN